MWYIVFPRERSNLIWQRVDYIGHLKFPFGNWITFAPSWENLATREIPCSQNRHFIINYSKMPFNALMKALMNEGSCSWPFFFLTAKPTLGGSFSTGLLFSFSFCRHKWREISWKDSNCFCFCFCFFCWKLVHSSLNTTICSPSSCL